MTTAAPSDHCGRVTIVYLKAKHFSIEELCLHVSNVIIFQLVTRQRRCHVVGCYISTSDALTIEDVSADTMDLNYGAEILVDSDLNTNLVDPESIMQGEATSDVLAAVEMMNIGLHFLPRSKPWLHDRCMWIIQKYS